MDSLQQSIQLLDDPIQSKRGLFRKSVRNQREDDVMDFDMSITMAPNEIRRFLNNTTFNNATVTGDLTTKFLRYNSNSNLSTASTGGGTSTNTVFTTRNKTDQLFTQFLEILQSRTNDSEIFETVQDIIQVLTDLTEDVSKEDIKRREKYDSDTEDWVRSEKNTWKLLYCLYKDRLIAQKDGGLEMDELPLINSEKNIVERLYLVNGNLREYQLVVDWLEQTALEQNKMQMGMYTDRTVAWENTLHQLLQVSL
jgi:nuclear pore complex protein Nup107